MTSCSFESIESKASYGIGLQFGQHLKESGLVEVAPEALLAGLTDALAGNTPVLPVEEIHQALRTIHEHATEVRQQQQLQLMEIGKQFLAENASKEGVNCTESGLQFSVVKQGDGPIPTRQDKVRVHYTGRLLDGTVFDSSVERGQPAEFPVNGVIPGWIEALTLMPVGSTWTLYITQELAYGERGAGAAIPPYSALVFDVELLAII